MQQTKEFVYKSCCRDLVKPLSNSFYNKLLFTFEGRPRDYDSSFFAQLIVILRA
jgi:hypothetical protein